MPLHKMMHTFLHQAAIPNLNSSEANASLRRRRSGTAEDNESDIR